MSELRERIREIVEEAIAHEHSTVTTTDAILALLEDEPAEAEGEPTDEDFERALSTLKVRLVEEGRDPDEMLARGFAAMHPKDADEITRLRTKVESLADRCEELADDKERLRAENERLRGSEACPDCGRGTYGAVACHESDCPSYEAENARLRARVEELEANWECEGRTPEELAEADKSCLKHPIGQPFDGEGT